MEQARGAETPLWWLPLWAGLTALGLVLVAVTGRGATRRAPRALGPLQGKGAGNLERQMNEQWHALQTPKARPRATTDRVVFVGFSIETTQIPALVRSLGRTLPDWVRYSQIQLPLAWESCSRLPVILELSLSPSTWAMTESGLTRALLTSLRPSLKRLKTSPRLAWFQGPTGDDLTGPVKLSGIEA